MQITIHKLKPLVMKGRSLETVFINSQRQLWYVVRTCLKYLEHSWNIFRYDQVLLTLVPLLT